MDSLARRMYELVEPIGVIPYFADEPTEALFELGFTNYWDAYFAGRAGPLGLTPPQVVDALFYNFAPGDVARHIPRVWDVATPTEAINARQRGSVLALKRILSAHVDSQSFARASELLLHAATSAPWDGRPMYAALRALPVPDGKTGRIFHAATLLREYRGDSHIAALMTEGIGGLEAHALLALHMDMPPEKFGRLHHLGSDRITQIANGLSQRGLIGEDGWLNDRGRAVKARVEARTDDLALRPYEALNSSEIDELISALEQFAVPLRAAQPW